MNTRTFLAVIAVVVLVGAAPLFACADEPAVHCTVATGTMSAKFYPVSAASGDTGDGGCPPLPGDVFGVTAYVPNPVDPGDGLSKLAIQSQTLGEARDNGEAADPPVVDPSANDSAYAIGKFDSVLPGPGGVCTVSQLAPAQIHLGAVSDPDAGIDQDPTDLKYAWSHVRILVNAAQIGVQMTGDLELTQSGCTQAYHVTGLYPSVSCAAMDDAGNAMIDDAGSPVLDPSQCSPDNGLNPNVDVVCDPVQALCVPAARDPF